MKLKGVLIDKSVAAGVSIGTNSSNYGIVQANNPNFICPEICVGMESPANPSIPINEEESIATDTIPPDGSDQEIMKWQNEMSLYNRIKDNIAVLNSNQILHDFVDSIRNTSIGQFGDIVSIFEWIQNDTIDSLTSIIVQSQINDAISINDGIVTNTIYEEAQKIINDIKFNTIAKNLFEYSQDYLSSIEDIAQRCPFSYGPAVFEARAMLELIYPNLYYNDDSVCSQSGGLRKRQFDNLSLETNFINVSPQPASTSVNIKYNINSKTTSTLNIYNSFGCLIFTERLRSNNELILPVKDFENGIYFYSIINSNQVIYHDRLIIMK